MSESVRQYFNRVADDFDAIYGRRGIGGWVDRRFRSDMFERFRLTFELFGNVGDKTVLDIGCGSGRYAVEFARRGARVTGIDFAPRMLELARAHAIEAGVAERCEFQQAALDELPAGQQYDVSLAIGVLDYVASPRSFVEHMRHHTRETMALTFPSRSPLRMPLRKLRYLIKRCPVYFYDGAQIAKIMAGFGTVEIAKIPGQGMDFFVGARLS
jgi:2-polyprenyl-3-methyl-5-hydroxy-6-metoxy-1,4-benzoquinol methylase